MTMVNLVQTVPGIQYDGTNSADILAIFPDSLSFSNAVVHPEIDSEVDGVLTIHYDDYAQCGTPVDLPINEGDWVIPDQPAGALPVITTNAVPLDTLTNP